MDSDKNFVYYGTSDFSRIILDGLLAEGYTPNLVVTTLGKPQGRGLKAVPTPVAKLSTDKSLPLLEVSSLKDVQIQQELKEKKTEVAILAAFGKIIPKIILDLYPLGIVNVHPSLLPLYRGPSPIQSALKDGQTRTGVTLIKLDDEVDHGPIIAKNSLDVNEDDTTVTLSEKLSKLAIEELIELLPKYLSGKVVLQEQEHENATFTKMITKEDGYTNFNEPAQAIERKIRAFTPWPGVWTNWQGKRLRIIQAKVVNMTISVGLVKEHPTKSDAIVIGCLEKALEPLELQLEGKKAMTVDKFLRGNKIIGANLSQAPTL